MIDHDKPMKYRDPRTGEVFTGDGTRFCGDVGDCGKCPIKTCFTEDEDCADWVNAHPAEAARLIGLVEVEDEKPCLSCNVGWGKPDTLDKKGEKCFESCERLRKWREAQMEKMDKPLICEVLGGKDDPLDVGEEFHVYGNSIPWHVNEKGRIVNGAGKECVSDVLYLAINHPDRIIRKPCFSQEEVALLRTLYAAGARYLARGKHLRWYSRKPCQRAEDDKWDMRGDWATMSGKLPAAMFQALRPGQSVKLEDILGGVHEAAGE